MMQFSSFAHSYKKLQFLHLFSNLWFWKQTNFFKSEVDKEIQPELLSAQKVLNNQA